MSGKAVHPDHAEFFAILGRRIKELRKERGWSLRDMILMHGYHLSQWQKYEKGGPVTVDSLLRMAAVFDMTLSQLLGDLVEFPRKGKAETGLVSARAAGPASLKKAVPKK